MEIDLQGLRVRPVTAWRGGCGLDNITHGLYGLGIYGVWAVATGHTALTGDAVGACLAAVIGSEAPDFDYAVRILRGPVDYLRQHRAASHSVPSWLMWPLPIALVLSLVWPGHWGQFYLLALAGVLVHVGLDILTSYGTQALWPFSSRRLALDCLFIVDIVLILCGFAGIALTLRGWPIGHAVLVFGGVSFLYIAWRCLHTGFLYDRLRRLYPGARRVSVLPGPMPWMWSYVVETEVGLEAGGLGNTGHTRPEVVWQQEPWDETAAFVFTHSRVGVVFRWFARHLIWTKTELESGTLLTMADATYRYGRVFPFTASVQVQPDAGGHGLRVVDERVRAQEVDRAALQRQLAAASRRGDEDGPPASQATLRKP
ncbi:MAG: metal-dependent hydrolase [Alicyclobacillus shizuokensis]|nr:metal-dependent hydrolase [Alicyclobacillus shizuokensis]